MVHRDNKGAEVCHICGKKWAPLSQILPICPNCIRRCPREAESFALEAHRSSRSPFGLPSAIPRDPSGRVCTLCANLCSLSEGQRSYCGLRFNHKGRVMGISPQRGKLSYYYDPLPTNCVADWVCPGGTGAGYPQFAHRSGPEQGYRNLAVFYIGCTFDCLYCQNWTFREDLDRQIEVTPRELAGLATGSTSCICYFGGDPTAQLHHALSTSRMALRNRGGRIMRICWETNGSMDRRLLKEMIDLSWPSGGCIKFDLKAWNEDVHRALCGVGNKRTRENFAYLASRISERPDPPPVIASTLMVPGYVDDVEVREIAKFIASLDVTIPYSLLAFSPQFFMKDLPYTSKADAERFLGVAREAGLKRLRIGNAHLLR